MTSTHGRRAGAAWRRLPFEIGRPEDLLAHGQRILDAMADVGVPTLRWYRASRPAVVLGRGQQSTLVRDASVPVVARYSGGGAVLMDTGLLSLDVFVPAGHPFLHGDLAAPFLRVGAAWAAALRDLGVPDVAVYEGPASARLRGTDRERLLAAICYATVGRGEVTSSGRKIVGLAQRRRRQGALLQCGLLRRWDPVPLLTALGASTDDPDILGAAVGLDDMLAPPPSDEVIMTAVEEHLTMEKAA